MPDPQRYELKVTASGTVRDADGNIIGEFPLEATTTLTEDQLREHIERMAT